MKPRNLDGMVFGRLTVLSLSEVRNYVRRWNCRCECGNITIVQGRKLLSGWTRSCGCLRQRHGMEGTSEYITWRSMLSRCLNPRAQAFSIYGGRGITVDPSWLDFVNFFRDMGFRPSGGFSLERKDNNRGYSKENCEWAPLYIQNSNRRTSTIVTAFGVTDCAASVARSFGVNPLTFRRRMKRGLTPEQAILGGSK